MKIEKQWVTTAGYKAEVIATEMGHRCGYVTLPEDHACGGKDYYDIDVSVHGGLTYGDGIKYGFDCAHLYDAKDLDIMSEKYYKIYSPMIYEGGTVKTLEYCVAQCEKLATQLKELA